MPPAVSRSSSGRCNTATKATQTPPHRPTVWVVSHQSHNYDPISKNGVYPYAFATKEAAKNGAYRLLKGSTEDVLERTSGFSTRTLAQISATQVDDRYNHNHRERSDTKYDVSLNWEGRYVRVRYEELGVLG